MSQSFNQAVGAVINAHRLSEWEKQGNSIVIDIDWLNEVQNISYSHNG